MNTSATKPPLPSEDGYYAQVFVYGTLMRGCANQAALGQAELLADNATVRGQLYLPPDADYPALVQEHGTVKGELYCLPKAELRRLDLFEGVPWLYDRVRVKVHIDGQPDHWAWVYVYRRHDRETMAKIGSSWRQFADVHGF